MRVQPARTAIAEAGAWRVSGNEEVQAIAQDFTYIALNMPVAVMLRRQQIARPGVVAFSKKGIANDS